MNCVTQKDVTTHNGPRVIGNIMTGY